ncbi:unnamed protein product [Trypanosoma congolense IL3000]|uniref:WGS project CAEQ00000000 data, annotated contig 2439 n=1 Tax=Trypanosoma congolense (strain IL3000) TaxID=1068625 RepID=F9WE48_TRYCI|nr:unnamed protein product [Trypanosoma congolense IL3000]
MYHLLMCVGCWNPSLHTGDLAYFDYTNVLATPCPTRHDAPLHDLTRIWRHFFSPSSCDHSARMYHVINRVVEIRRHTACPSKSAYDLRKSVLCNPFLLEEVPHFIPKLKLLVDLENTAPHFREECKEASFEDKADKERLKQNKPRREGARSLR